MTTDEFLVALEQAWRPARDLGALGGVTVSELWDHAAGFVPAAFRVEGEVKCLDIGTGVGVPGLILAHLLPHSRWILLDSSEKRCEIAQQAVNSVGLSDRVEVIHGRADDLAHTVGHRRTYDLVVSRLFGGVSETAECGLPFVREGGSMVASCLEKSVDTWRDGVLVPVGGSFRESWKTDAGVFVAIDGVAGLVDRFPRRPAARGRDPFL